ncbi:MAG: hypothetical protein QGI45_10845 [Myxococcota bacterium]|nr:hypothetical protein [Myxococcota bacterium]
MRLVTPWGFVLWSLLLLACNSGFIEYGTSSEPNQTPWPEDSTNNDDIICPITDTVVDPVVVQKFQDNEEEYEAHAEHYRVIVPAGYEQIADDLLPILPTCETTIENFLGYCRSWSEVIVHIGLYTSQKSKVEDGVVYLGRTAHTLSNWIERDYWGQATGPCGGDNTLAHETVHTFQTAHAPAWLKEGQAEYLAAVVLAETHYQCDENDMAICNDAECTTYPYWDLSDNNWQGGNKHLYYKTGTCFWQLLTDEYGGEKIRNVARSLAASPLEAVGNFPFSAETNALIINHHFIPYLGDDVWEKIARFGIEPSSP